MPTRRNTMRSGTEEHAKIADVITKFDDFECCADHGCA